MAKTFNREEQLHALVDGKKIIITESSVRRDLQLADKEGVDCLPNSTIFEQLTLMGPKTTAWNEFRSTMASAIICLATNQKFNFSKFIFENEVVHKELGDSLVRPATTVSSLEAEHDSGNLNKTQSKATPNESSSQGTNSGGGPWCQETMRDTIAQTRFESVSKHSNDSLIARGNILQSDEDRLKLDELMALCTTLQNWVLDLEKTKTTQHNEIASLKRRVKKLEKKDKSRTHRLKRLYNVGLTARVESYDNEEKQDVDEVINTAKLIIDATQVSVASDIVSIASATTTVSAATTTTAIIKTVDDIILAQALEEMKSTKSKKKGVIIQELAEFDEEERLAREKTKKEEEANIALIETWDDIQAKIDANHQLAEKCKHKNKKSFLLKKMLYYFNNS
ncbi:hypothetical protein Tco_0851114 [Tanacetum coccineum]